MLNQKTLAQSVVLEGIGLHSGRDCRVQLDPSPENTGITFKVPDSKGDVGLIDANWQNIANTVLCTELQGQGGRKIRTIEHLMSALRACNIDNVQVICSSNEVPILDGSSLPFARAIQKVGLRVQHAPRRLLKIRKPVRVEIDDKWAEFLPYDGCRYEMEIDFANHAIGQQLRSFDLRYHDFMQQIAPARTFGELDQASGLHAAGLALGASPSNTLIFDRSVVVSYEGKRFADECVRHKILDAIGDLHLVGGPILGHFKGFKSGHNLHSLLLEAVMTTVGAASWVTGGTHPICDDHPEQVGNYLHANVSEPSSTPARVPSMHPSFTAEPIEVFDNPGMAKA